MTQTRTQEQKKWAGRLYLVPSSHQSAVWKTWSTVTVCLQAVKKLQQAAVTSPPVCQSTEEASWLTAAGASSGHLAASSSWEGHCHCKRLPSLQLHTKKELNMSLSYLTLKIRSCRSCLSYKYLFSSPPTKTWSLQFYRGHDAEYCEGNRKKWTQSTASFFIWTCKYMAWI